MSLRTSTLPRVQVLLNPVAGVGKPETTATNGKHRRDVYTAHAWAKLRTSGSRRRKVLEEEATETGPSPPTAPTVIDASVDTISQLAVSISELHHLVPALRHDLSTSNPPLTTVPSSSPPAPAPPTAPTPTAAQPSGELQLRRLFPWISKEVAQLVYNDRLPPHDLGKLRNPAKVATSKDAEPGVLVNGVHVTVPEPTGRAQGDAAYADACRDGRSRPT
ncbi:uncharacterized protein UDID_18824 [Ustilago sp. UG-2017a]|nr:uncharacterized protein UDID_18824 [Ustilago sp. UG-2017a]